MVAAKAMFGACRYVIAEILPRFGITHTLVDGTDVDQWQSALTPATKMLFLETPANPTLAIVDLKAVARIADAGRRAADRRQRVRDAGAAAADGIRARISWCIPPPNISTDRAARWAA